MKIEAELYQTDLVVPEIYWEDGVIPVETEENGGHAYYFQEEKNRRREEEEEERLKSLKELQTEFENETEFAETTYQKEVELLTRNVDETEKIIGKTVESKIEGIIEKPDDIALILAIIEATS